MKSFNIAALIIFFCVLSISIQSQDPQIKKSINEGSINDQFEFVISKSSNWNDKKGQTYEVIKRSMFFTLKDHVMDSLDAIHQALNKENDIVKAQEIEIQRLTTEFEKIQNQLEDSEKEKNSIAFLGFQLSKSTYRLITRAIIAALLVLLAIFIFSNKNSGGIARETKQRLSELEEEFAEHKRISLEREQLVKRQLQDHINKRIN